MRLGEMPTDIHRESVAEGPACLVQQQTGEMLIVPREQHHEPSITMLNQWASSPLHCCQLQPCRIVVGCVFVMFS